MRCKAVKSRLRIWLSLLTRRSLNRCKFSMGRTESFSSSNASHGIPHEVLRALRKLNPNESSKTEGIQKFFFFLELCPPSCGHHHNHLYLNAISAWGSLLCAGSLLPLFRFLNSNLSKMLESTFARSLWRRLCLNCQRTCCFIRHRSSQLAAFQVSFRIQV